MQKDWNALVARADEPDLPLTLMGGYDALIGRVRTLAEHPDLSARAKGNLAGLLEYHDKEAKARRMAQGWLADAELRRDKQGETRASIRVRREAGGGPDLGRDRQDDPRR